MKQLRIPEYCSHFKETMFYQRQPLFQALSVCRNWRVAIDAGAHVGFMSRDLALLFGEVRAFEPGKDNYECLIENTPDNVYAYNAALGARRGRCGLFNPAPGNSGAWEVRPGEELPVMALDEYEFEDVDFMKIDVQGFEEEVLRGAEKTLLRNEPVLMMESENNGVFNEGAVNFCHEIGMLPLYRVKRDLIWSWSGKVFKRPILADEQALTRRA